MLKLLLDEHVSPDVADGLRRKLGSLSVHSLAQWEGGRLLGFSNEAILEEAAARGLTLVTYDLRTIPLLLKIWMEAGRDHGGVVLVDNKTIPASNFGGLIRALRKLVGDAGQEDGMNRVSFLQR